MAENSDVCKEQAIIWKTEKAYDDKKRVSSVFSMAGATWQLEKIIHIDYYHGLRYEIYLNRIGDIEPNTQLSVIIFLQTTKSRSRPYECNFRSPSRQSKIMKEKTLLWYCKLGDASRKISVFHGNTELTIICVFIDTLSASPGVLNETVEVTTQTEFDRILPLKTLHGDKLSSGESEPGASCVSSNLDSLSGDLSKLLEDEVLPDISLRCGDRRVAAHKAVLAARSKVFTAMFQSKMSESETGVVEIADIDVQVLELFLKYLYTGRLFESSHEHLLSLYAAGEKYAVSSLMMACSEHLINNLTQDNCFNFLLMADAHGNQEFKNAIFDFILNHVEILAGEEWKIFSQENFTLSYEVLQMVVKQKCLS